MITLPVRHSITGATRTVPQYNAGRIPIDSQQDQSEYCINCGDIGPQHYIIEVLFPSSVPWHRPVIRRCPECYSCIIQNTAAARDSVEYANLALCAILNEDLARVIAQRLVALKCAEFIEIQSDAAKK